MKRTPAITCVLFGRLVGPAVVVDADRDGVVRPTGSVSTQEAADKAVSVVHDTDQVKAANSETKIKK